MRPSDAGVDRRSQRPTTKMTRPEMQSRDLHFGTIYYDIPYKALLGFNYVDSVFGS